MTVIGDRQPIPIETCEAVLGMRKAMAQLHAPRDEPLRQDEHITLALLAAASYIDVDTLKTVFSPGPRLASWSTYNRVLHTVDAPPAVAEQCHRWHAQLTGVLERWSQPPADIVALASAAEFTAALRDMRERPSRLPYSTLEARLRRRDRGRDSWGRSQLRTVLNAQSLPSPSKYLHMRNLLAELCAHAGRPAEDAGHFVDAWMRLLPRTSQWPFTLTRWTDRHLAWRIRDHAIMNSPVVCPPRPPVPTYSEGLSWTPGAIAIALAAVLASVVVLIVVLA